MLLAIDVGNTHTVLGLYCGELLQSSWRLQTDRDRTADEWSVLIGQLFQLHQLDFSGVEGVIISCVVPPLSATLSEMCRSCFGLAPYLVSAKSDTGIAIEYDFPHEVGADRIVNAAAAYAKHHTSLIIVDFGTATTFDYLSDDGCYLGGAIAPGLNLSAEALYSRTSKLPRVEITCPPKVIAKNTVNSIQSGLFYGYVGLVDGIVTRMQEEGGGGALVLATGGLASVIASYSRTIAEVDTHLTLEGLRIIYQRNRASMPVKED